MISALEAKGFEAYAVGGCVRDLILARDPQDFDITTNALPGSVKKIFRNTVDTGIAHGTVTVVLYPDTYEVTTYRIDGDYADGRHPDHVDFTSRLSDDLCRRDFTINAMAYHPDRGLTDLYGGMEDLSRHVIRCVGDPMERFSEDALRILRAYRFAAQLGFSIEEKTRDAARALAGTLRKISAERIRTELMKLLVSPNPGILRDMAKDGITAVILPELDACFATPQHSSYHLYDVGEHTVRTVEAVAPDPLLRLTMLLHDFGKTVVHFRDASGTDHFKGHAAAGAKMAEKILRDLKFDNKTIKNCVTLIRYHDLRPRIADAAVRRALFEIGPDLFPKYLAVQRADADAKNPQRMVKTYERIDAVEKIYEGILARRDALSLRDLCITGNDLKAAGISGPETGFILQSALLCVLEEPALNTREILLAYAMYVHHLRDKTGNT